MKKYLKQYRKKNKTLKKQIPQFKKCNVCKQTKPKENFIEKPFNPDGLDYECKKCHAKRAMIYHYNNQEKIKIYKKSYRQKNKKKLRKLNKDWRKNNKTHLKEYYKKPEVHIKRIERDNKRKRNLKFIPLFKKPFPKNIKVDYHHINNLIVIPIPKKLHHLTFDNNRENHRNKCDKIIKKLYYLDIDKILTP